MVTVTVSSHLSALLNLQNLFSRQALRRLVGQTLRHAEAGETLPVVTQASIARPAKSSAASRKYPSKTVGGKVVDPVRPASQVARALKPRISLPNPACTLQSAST